MATLTIQGLHKYYGKTHVLRGIDLHIEDGEFTVFVGPSGCGKSTLLRTIAGLESINKGSIAIDGKVVNNLRPRDRDIAMVFQNYALYPYMSVAENIAFGLRARKLPESEIQEKVKFAARMLEIENLLDRFPRHLSGGQRQRVAIGRAVVRDALLFLFDEPLSNLDAQLREGMRSEFKQLHQQVGKTMVYVTHDQVEAMTLADRIVLLRDGVIEQAGSPLELFERPVNQFVAGFLGSPTINFVPATIESSGQGLCARFNNDIRVELPMGRVQALAPYVDKEIICGIRPEHFTTRGESDITVTVDLLQPTGSRSYVSFRLADTRVTAEMESQTISGAGEQIAVSIDAQRMLLFDRDTQLALH